VNNDTYFDKFTTLKNPTNVKVGDGRILQATKIGQIEAIFQVYNCKTKVTIPNVFYVKDMKANLISYSKVTDKNKIISVGDKSKIYDRNNKLIAMATKKGDLYEIKSLIINKQNAEVYTNITTKIVINKRNLL